MHKARTFITTVHIAATVIRWRLLGKERTGQTQFSTKFATKLSSYALKPSILFFPCFLRSHPLCDQTGGSNVVNFLTLRINLFSLRRGDKLVTQSFSSCISSLFALSYRGICGNTFWVGIDVASYWSPVKNWLPSWLGARAKKGPQHQI
jgi:hypothetical protein